MAKILLFVLLLWCFIALLIAIADTVSRKRIFTPFLLGIVTFIWLVNLHFMWDTYLPVFETLVEWASEQIAQLSMGAEQ